MKKLFIAAFALASVLQLSASCGYDNELPAWGGNAGWWGGGNNDFYSDRSWRTDEDYSYYCHRCRRSYNVCSRCGAHTYAAPNRGCNRYTPPNNEYQYNDTVPGAGLYLNLESK